MFAIGVLIGFIGAGGAGVTVSVLTLVFHLPIHQAVGTALAAMVFTTISGALSHYREGNVAIRPGLIIGAAGMVGAVIGAQIGQSIPEATLQILAGFALWFLAFLVWLRTQFRKEVAHIPKMPPSADLTRLQVATGGGLGVAGGMASAFFGVGMAPFVQLGMLTIMRLPLIVSVGTTMLALSLISLSGSAALATQGNVRWLYLVGVIAGMTSGSYVGAKFTRRAPVNVLRWAIILTPFVAGTMLLVF